MRAARTLGDLLLASWFGGSLFLALVAAPAVFQKAANRELAGNIVGAMLWPWRWASFGIPLTLIALRLFAGRTSTFSRRTALTILSAAVVFSLFQFVVDGRVHAIREASPFPISSLSRQDPLRRRFGLLHGVSSLLLLAQTAAAGAVIVLSANDAANDAAALPGRS